MMGGKVILDPSDQSSTYRPDGDVSLGDTSGCTIVDVADGFTWAGKTVDWSGTPSVVDDLEAVRDARWEAAKAYRAQRQSEPLAIPGVVSGDVIIAQRDPDGQAWIDRMVAAATAAMVVSQPLEVTFTDFANRPFTVEAPQILAIGAASMTQQALCHAASQAVRAALDAAVGEGLSAAAISEIDITAGYPASGAPE